MRPPISQFPLRAWQSPHLQSVQMITLRASGTATSRSEPGASGLPWRNTNCGEAGTRGASGGWRVWLGRLVQGVGARQGDQPHIHMTFNEQQGS